ncbi:NTF2 fold immunity protein [Capnocytophaga cynodegmi]|nr:NTF2 fold immunity protein [Capnocytophaga cynodegmi]
MNETEQIKQQFITFMQKMNAWEVVANNETEQDDEIFSNPDWQEKQTQIVREIYETHLTQKERKHGMLNAGISVRFPPEYDSDKETIISVEIKGKSAVMITERIYAGLKGERIYKLKKVDDVWKIDTAKEKSKSEDKWHSVIF